MAAKKLQKIRVAALATDGFEQIELLRPLERLRDEGAEVDVVSLRPGKIRGVNLLVPGKSVRVDRLLSEVSPDEYGALLLPGGFVNPDVLRQSDEARAFVAAFEREKKPIATLCHGPWVLISANLVSGRTMTSWPGIADDVRNAGAVWKDEEGVRDGNWFTSRGPHDMRPFMDGMVALFAELAPETKAADGARWLRTVKRAGAAVAVASSALLVGRRFLAKT